MTTVQPPASRNAPCPCGSGRRYKDCHGAIAQGSVGAGPANAEAEARRQARLGDALKCQQAGDLAGALAGYEAVLVEFPDDFDALHMLGVVHYQRHAFDRAEALLLAAIARNPLVSAAQQNLALLQEARRLEDAQDALCRTILPRLAHLCAPPSAFATLVRERRSIDLLDGAAVGRGASDFVRLADGALGPARVHAAVPERTVDAPAHAPVGSLEAAITVLYGVATPLAAFPSVPREAARVLVIDVDAPSALHERLRELSDEARHPVHLRYATAALAATVGLPGASLWESG